MRIHSLLSPKCSTGASTLGGRGLFANTDFSARELVGVWGGKVYTTDECLKPGSVFPHCKTHPVAMCEGYYLGSENLFELDDAELINHSCEPNVGIQGQVVLITRRAVLAGEELLIDYETLDDSPFEFECRCGSPSCRTRLSGGMWQDQEFCTRNSGFLSWYLEELIRRSARTAAGIQFHDEF